MCYIIECFKVYIKVRKLTLQKEGSATLSSPQPVKNELKCQVCIMGSVNTYAPLKSFDDY